jgi:hypothetical protein
MQVLHASYALCRLGLSVVRWSLYEAQEFPVGNPYNLDRVVGFDNVHIFYSAWRERCQHGFDYAPSS